jgi:hypothetical protein
MTGTSTSGSPAFSTVYSRLVRPTAPPRGSTERKVSETSLRSESPPSTLPHREAARPARSRLPSEHRRSLRHGRCVATGATQLMVSRWQSADVDLRSSTSDDTAGHRQCDSQTRRTRACNSDQAAGKRTDGGRQAEYRCRKQDVLLATNQARKRHRSAGEGGRPAGRGLQVAAVRVGRSGSNAHPAARAAGTMRPGDGRFLSDGIRNTGNDQLTPHCRFSTPLVLYLPSSTVKCMRLDLCPRRRDTSAC